jgi:hypothetical protein
MIFDSPLPTTQEEEKSPELPWDDCHLPRYPSDLLRHVPPRRSKITPQEWRERVKAVIDFYRPSTQKETRNGK